jgi:RNA polymerase sigma-70 factor (ECF subfamily)
MNAGCSSGKLLQAVRTLGFEVPVLSPAVEATPSVLDRVRQGDLDALAEVYDLHHRALCAFARRLLSDEAAAEDLVHDVFVLLPTVAHRVDPARSLRSFLVGIAANRARHYFRARARFSRMTERLAKEPVTAHAATPEQEAHRTRLARALSRALDTLSLEQRLAFVLCEIEGQGSREVAETLSVPEGTVRTRLFAARKKLREQLEKEGIG